MQHYICLVVINKDQIVKIVNVKIFVQNIVIVKLRFAIKNLEVVIVKKDV